MAGVFMDDGIKDSLTNMIAGLLNGATIHLYTNNHTPTTADVIGNYTEATFTGYSSQTLSGWTASSVSGHVATTTANPATFTLTAGSQNIYGYYVLDAAGDLIFAQIDLAAPVAMTVTVNTYQITVSVTTQSA